MMRTAVLAAALLCALSPTDSAWGSAQNYIQAFYLYNLILFADWPETDLEDTETIRLTVFGHYPFYNILARMQNKTIKGKRLVVTYCSSEEEIRGCHILYISPSEKSRWPHIRDKIKGAGILTVSDIEDFARMEGMIGFIHGNHPLQKTWKRLEINLTSVESEGIRLSSRLLRLAVIVTHGQPGKREARWP